MSARDVARPVPVVHSQRGMSQLKMVCVGLLALGAGCATDDTGGSPAGGGGGKADGDGPTYYLRFDVGDVTGDGGYYTPRSFEATEHVYASSSVFGRWSIEGSTSAIGLQNPTVGIVVPHATGDYDCSTSVNVVHAANPSYLGPVHLWTTKGQTCAVSVQLDDAEATVTGTASGTLTNGIGTIPFTVEFFAPDLP